MSPLTRTGLWLLPWCPAALIVLTSIHIYYPNLDPCPLEMGFGPLPLTCRIQLWLVRALLLAFLVGIILLAATGVRRLVRWRRQSA
jgi:hypothetical protein